ncbi:MAG: molybdopterin-guanine dinucleotide biosynthesis protein B [Firmicutes bacterium]|nr:molybdopterin-guanine dinucleotide biosynthesis protein B [Bacillota bacterium]
MPVPYVVICGRSGTGKTTLIEGLLRELCARGLCVGVVKHTGHHVEFDHPGKDTWRFSEAGASSTCLVTPEGYAIYRPKAGEASLGDVLRHFEGADLVLVEGFKGARASKIEVTGSPDAADLVCGDDPGLLAVVAPGAAGDSGHAGALPRPVYRRDDHAGIADLIVRKILEEHTRSRRI